MPLSLVQDAFLWLAQKLHVRCLPLLNLVGKPDMQAKHWLPVFC